MIERLFYVNARRATMAKTTAYWQQTATKAIPCLALYFTKVNGVFCLLSAGNFAGISKGNIKTGFVLMPMQKPLCDVILQWSMD